MKYLDVGLTVALAGEGRVVRPPFVHAMTIQVDQPRLNVPGRDEDANSLMAGALCDARVAAGSAQLIQTCMDSTSVPVDHHHERLIQRPAAVSPQLVGEVTPHELLRRAPSGRRFDHPDPPI